MGLSVPNEASLTIPEDAPPEQQPLAPQKQYGANIGSVIRALTRSRANGQLLHDSEWRAYEEAIASGRYRLPVQTCAPSESCTPRDTAATDLHPEHVRLERHVSQAYMLGV